MAVAVAIYAASRKRSPSKAEMSSEPPVSVVIPAYNQSRFLGEAIESALSQTLAGVEVIVVDDGSTDDTPRVARAFRDRIIYIRQSNQGLAGARNTGITAARAGLIQLLDSDDALYPTAVERGWEAAASNPDAGVFTASWDETDAAGGVIGQVEAPAIARDAFHALFDPMLVGPPCRYMVRRAELLRAGLFDRSLRACEDWDMWLRLAAAGVRFVAVPEARVRYRNHPASMSKDPRLMWRSGLRVLDRAADAHRSCACCRQAKRRGTATWREWCYVAILAPRLHGQPYRRAAGSALLALARDPKLARLLAGSLRRRSRGQPPPWTHMVKPDFFVIGAQRAGTTRLCALLDRHPSVRIPTKEPMYFQSLEHMREKAGWYESRCSPTLPMVCCRAREAPITRCAGYIPGRRSACMPRTLPRRSSTWCATHCGGSSQHGLNCCRSVTLIACLDLTACCVRRTC